MNAKRDENRVTTLTGALNTDGVTPTLIYANPVNHALKIQDGITGSDLSSHVAPRDENRIPVGMAVSSADGVTPITLYADSLNRLLVQIN